VTIRFEHVAALFTVAKRLGSPVADLADTAKYGFVLRNNGPFGLKKSAQTCIMKVGQF
jgi:hypothetical protein